MSRHYLDATVDGKPVTVIAGWDPTFSGWYFLDIQEATGDEDDETFVYSSIYDPKHGQSKSFEPFVDILQSYGITLPDPMILAIGLDGENQVTNKVTRWTVESAG